MNENEKDKLPEQGDIFMQTDSASGDESVDETAATEDETTPAEAVAESVDTDDAVAESPAVEAQEEADVKPAESEAGKSFEEILGRLETIVEKMENGGLKLEESMALYEEGVSKAETLTSLLADSRGRVLKLIGDTEGETKLEAFEEEDDQ